MDSWVIKMVRARSIRQVAVWGLLLGCLGYYAWCQQRYLKNFLMGPFVMGQAELDSIKDIDTAPRYFARVSGTKAFDTGMQQITVRKRHGREMSRGVSGAYYALMVGDRFLLVMSSAGPPSMVEGELKDLPSSLSKKLFNTPEMRTISQLFYPFYLDDGFFRIPGYVGLAGALLFGYLLFGLGLPAWRYCRDPYSHPVVLRMASWGDAASISRDAEEEAQAARFEGGGWLMTDRYFIKRTFNSFDLLRLRDVLWAYKEVTKHRFGLIPTGKTYVAVFNCYGGSAEVSGSENEVDEMLALAEARVPWAVFGFSNELKKIFEKQNPEFCAGVEQRKQDWR
jgi:hypothetical protein